MSERSDEELMLAFANNDAQAFETLYKRRQKMLFIAIFCAILAILIQVASYIRTYG